MKYYVMERSKPGFRSSIIFTESSFISAADITAFWTDLGEPEIFDLNQFYYGYQEDFSDNRTFHQEGDIHK